MTPISSADAAHVPPNAWLLRDGWSTYVREHVGHRVSCSCSKIHNSSTTSGLFTLFVDIHWFNVSPNLRLLPLFFACFDMLSSAAALSSHAFALCIATRICSCDTFVILDAFTFHSPCLADRLLQLGQHSVDVFEIAQLGGGGRGEDVGVGTYKHGIHTLCLSSDFINLCKLHMCKWSLLSSYSSSLPILEL